MHKALKIVQALHAFPPHMGGIETHTYNLSLQLAKQGHKVIIHTSKHKDSKQVDQELNQAGIQIKRHFSIQIPGFSSVRIFPLLCIPLALENADIYHSHGFGSLVPLQTSIASFLARKKFIWTIHGYPKLNAIGAILTKLYSIAAHIPLLIANKIICVSQDAKSHLPKYAQNKSVIVPNGISEDFFSKKQTKKQSKQFKVLFVGRLDKSKGIFLLADAFNEFRKTHDARLAYNGPNEGRNKELLLNYAQEHNFCTEISHMRLENMPEVYKSADVTVLPSDYEGFGLSVLESWAAGTPAISASVGIIPKFFKEAFKKDADKFIFHDKKSLINCLDFIYSLKDSQKKNYIKKAHTALKEYKWEKIAKDTVEIYKN